MEASSRSVFQASETPDAWARLAVPVALAILPLVAVIPLLRPGLFATHDGLFHLFRAVQLDASLREGNFYPRWAADFAQGFGYPIFNFYAPAGNYLQVLLHYLGLSFVDALKVALGLCYLAGGVGTYLFVSATISKRAGIVAAAAFVYSPYLFMNGFIRFDFAEQLALAILPFVLWAFHRLINRGTTTAFVFASVMYGTLVLSHNLTAFFFSPILGTYCLVSTVTLRRWRALLVVAAALAVGLGLSAFFWLPAIGEKDLVQIDRLTNTSAYDVRNNLIAWEQMLGLQPLVDLRQGNPQPNYRFGTLHLIVAGLGVLAVATGRLSKPGAVTVVFFGLVSLLLAVMMSAISIPAWDALPLMGLIQFPWRLFGITALTLAVVAGAAVELLPRGLDRSAAVTRAFTYVAVPSLVLLFALSVTVYQYYLASKPAVNVPANPTTVDSVLYERASRTVGTSTGGEYLPVQARWLPMPKLEDTALPCKDCLQIERLDRGILPADSGIRAVQIAHRSDYESYRISSPGEALAVFRLYYYPAWHAYVDGLPARITPLALNNLGWVTVNIGPGEHAVEVRFEATPLAQVGNVISLVSLALVCLVLVAGTASRRKQQYPVAVTEVQGGVHVRWAWSITLLAALLFVARIAYADGQTNWLRASSPPGVANPARHPWALSFEDQVLCIGYDEVPTTVMPGQKIDVRAYWELAKPAPWDFVFLLKLRDKNGTSRAETMVAEGRDWQIGKYYALTYGLQVPKDLAPGQYDLMISVHDPRPPERDYMIAGSTTGRAEQVLATMTVLP